MTPYLSAFRTRFKALLQYRGAALAGVATQLVWGLIRIMVFQAFFTSSGSHPMNLSQTVTYIWLGQAFLGMFPWNVDSDIQEMITRGTVSYELLRPLNIYALWFSRTLGWRASTVIMRSVFMLAFFTLAYPLLRMISCEPMLPVTFFHLPVFLFSLLCALFLSCTITTLINITLIYTISGRGINLILPGIALFTSGMIVPLPFFPGWARGILEVLPFRGIVDTPYRIYMGNIAVVDWIPALLQQVIWIVLLLAAGHFLLNRALKNMVIQGG